MCRFCWLLAFTGTLSACARTPAPTHSLAVPKAVTIPGMQNVHQIAEGVMTGPTPYRATFPEMSRLKYKTVVSVELMPPDVSLAREFKIRPVHIPVSYGGISRERGLLLGRALRDLPKPIYIYCRNGADRAPAAACAALLCVDDQFTNERAVAFLTLAGTPPAFPGLYGIHQRFARPSQPELHGERPDSPESVPPSAFAAAMAELDRLCERIERSPPPALSEAVALGGVLRQLMDDSPGDRLAFEKLANRADVLASAVRAGDQRRASAMLRPLRAECHACHVMTRDQIVR